jgi:hypothetical protein
MVFAALAGEWWQIVAEVAVAVGDNLGNDGGSQWRVTTRVTMRAMTWATMIAGLMADNGGVDGGQQKRDDGVLCGLGEYLLCWQSRMSVCQNGGQNN